MAMAFSLNKAKELVDGAYYDERGMKDVMRQDAAIYAAIAQAEALERIAVALETLAGTVVPLHNGESCINTYDNSRSEV